MTDDLVIIEDCLNHSGIQALLQEHLAQMHLHSPPANVYALPADSLTDSRITFLGAFSGESVAGCGALRELDVRHGEIKSMRTATSHQRRGIATQILGYIINLANERGYSRLSLETGSGPAFIAAHQLYLSHGFEFCGPFSCYTENTFSRFMTLKLSA